MFNWRWHLFWLKDKLTGGRINKVYSELERDFDNLDISRQKEKLDYLLKYAQENCDFYKNCSDSITNFPVINKQIIKDNFDKIFVSKKYNKDSLHKMSTSGSTGTPFTVYQNVEKRNAVLAEVLFFGKKANFEFGEKEVYSRIWVKRVKKNNILAFLQNLIQFDTSLLDWNNLKSLDDLIWSKKVKCLLGYASTLHEFERYLLKKSSKRKYNIKSIISGSELLNEDVRKNLSNFFSCNVYSRYSNEENGMLGQDFGYDKTFWLNESNYFFEFLKTDCDDYATEDELARIVITDLYNYAMPMIRYDTGDLCKFSVKNGKKYINELHGRKVDLIYDTRGNELSPHIITNNMWEQQKIIQWKFTQKAKKEYEITLNVDKDFNDESRLNDTFKRILGNDAKISFSYVNEIPVLSSGKRKYIENLYQR